MCIFDCQGPGVYRKGFTKRAEQFTTREDLEDKRLRLEREMISNFRTAGAAFLSKYSPTEMYFSAQHFGMPTRLLDWSTNPLAALFFACEGEEGQDGFVYAMDSRKVIPEDAKKPSGERLWQPVMLMRNPIVQYAVGVSFWMPLDPKQKPYVLPVRPDVIPGRLVSKVPASRSTCIARHLLIIQHQ
jgi:FRG domain